MPTKTFYAVGTIIAAVLCFQLFLRFNYVHLNGGRVMRIDRLTQSSCYMPCLPTPPPPTPTPYNEQAAYEQVSDEYDKLGEEAVQLAKVNPQAESIVNANDGADYEWTTNSAVSLAFFHGFNKNPMLTKGAHFTKADFKIWYPKRSDPVLVCYCNSKGTGWRWEVHLDSGDIYYVNDNADLSKKYGLTPATAQP